MRTLKAALLGATFLIGAAATASAADVYQPEPVGSYKDAAPYYPAITWTGFYVGGHLGGTFGDELNVDGEDVDIDNAFMWGAHVGYNWQTPSNWVFGLEGDLSGINDEIEGVDITDYVATVRGRLGIARGATLFYGTAGLAFLGYDDNLFEEATGDELEDAFGFVAGGGLEHKFGNNFSLGLEGLYYDVSSDVDSREGEEDLDRDFFTVRARLNYHFGSSYEAPLK